MNEMKQALSLVESYAVILCIEKEANDLCGNVLIAHAKNYMNY